MKTRGGALQHLGRSKRSARLMAGQGIMVIVAGLNNTIAGVCRHLQHLHGRGGNDQAGPLTRSARVPLERRSRRA